MTGVGARDAYASKTCQRYIGNMKFANLCECRAAVGETYVNGARGNWVNCYFSQFTPILSANFFLEIKWFIGKSLWGLNN